MAMGSRATAPDFQPSDGVVTPKGVIVFFEFLSAHWVVSLVLIGIYGVLFYNTISRFRKILKESRLHEALFWWSPLGSTRLRLAWRGVYWVTITLLEVFMAPLLWFIVRSHDKKEWEKKYREEVALREREALARQRRNFERAERRREWLIANPPTLYYNIVCGITAVVRPYDYDRIRMETFKAIRNELWSAEAVLMPIPETFVFLQESGRQRFATNLNTESPFNHACGWLTDLDELVRKNNVRLEKKPDIFVPYVNEGLLPFGKHTYRRPGRFAFELVDAQAPANMQPV